MNFVLRFDQPQALPELRLADDLDRSPLHLPPRGLVEPIALARRRTEREILLADHDQVGRRVGAVEHRGPLPADQLGNVAFRHAGQFADKGDPLVAKKLGSVLVGRHRVRISSTVKYLVHSLT